MPSIICSEYEFDDVISLTEALDVVARHIGYGPLNLRCDPQMNVVKACELLGAHEFSVWTFEKLFKRAVKVRNSIRQEGAKALNLADSDELNRWINTPIAERFKERLTRELSATPRKTDERRT